MILILNLQSQEDCLQTERLFYQGRGFNAFNFGGRQRTENIQQYVVGNPFVVSQMLVYFFELPFKMYIVFLILQAVLYIFSGGTCSTVLWMGVKMKKGDKKLWDPIPCSGISVWMTEVVAYLSSKPGIFASKSAV